MAGIRRIGGYWIILGIVLLCFPPSAMALEESSERLYTQGLSPFYEKDYKGALAFFQKAVEEERKLVFRTPDSGFGTELDQSLFPETLQREFENNKQPLSKLRFHVNDKDKNFSAQLDKQIFPDALRKEFSNKQLSFSGPVSVEVAQEHVWRIKSTGHTCFIIQQNDELYVYCPDVSDTVIVTVKEASRQWQLKATGKTYRIIKENDQLNVYEPPYYQAIYYLGITHGKLGQYAEAVPHLERTLKFIHEHIPTPHSAFVNRMLATTHRDLAVAFYHLDRFQEGVQSLNKAEALDPTDILAHYYKGLCHYRLEEYSEALVSLERAAQLADSNSEIGQRIARLTDQSRERRRQTKGWEIRLGMGSGFDSNVVLDPDGGASFNEISDQDDFLFTFSAGGSYDVISKSSFYLKASYDLYQTLHTDIDDFDLQAHQFKLTSRWQASPSLILGLEGGTNYFRLKNDDYLNELYAMPFLGYFVWPRTYTALSYRLTNQNYLISVFDPVRDGLRQEVSARQYFLLKDKDFNRYLFIGYQYSMDNPNLTLGNDFQYHNNLAEAGVHALLPWETTSADITYSFQNVDYSFPNTKSSPALSKKRADDIHRVSVVLRHQLTSFLEINMNYIGTINDSNINVFEYDRHMLSFGFKVFY